MLKRCLIAEIKTSWQIYFVLSLLLATIGILTVNISGNIGEISMSDAAYGFFSDERFDDLYYADDYLNETEKGTKLGSYEYFYESEDIVRNVAIEFSLAEWFFLPLSEGKWFDGAEPQVIVSLSMAEDHPVGSFMEFELADGGSLTARVVGVCAYDGRINPSGYMRSEMGGDPKRNLYEYDTPFIEISQSYPPVTVCVDDLSDYFHQSNAIVRMDADQLAEAEAFCGREIEGMRKILDDHIISVQPIIAMNCYVLYAIIAGFLIVSVSVSSGAWEISRLRLGVTMLCGATRRDLIICKAINITICSIAAICVTVLLGVAVGNAVVMIMIPEDIWKGVLAILATGAVTFAAGAIRISKTKILDLISGR